jgi:hypothetical protein
MTPMTSAGLEKESKTLKNGKIRHAHNKDKTNSMISAAFYVFMLSSVSIRNCAMTVKVEVVVFLRRTFDLIVTLSRPEPNMRIGPSPFWYGCAEAWG